ncbi:MAG: LacI family DNA-binding transcriptional regulator [Chloroflexi bacterium]|nr:LacI family DNA-binding transcriptional regulator [Chloroflexota bacterium]
MSISIKTIAEKANVSPSTVSRALHDDPRISGETRQLVQTLARELGYVPSHVARSLVLQRTHTLGVVVTTIADPYVGQVMAGIEQAIGADGYTLLLATSNGSAERELQAVETLCQRRVDALLVVSSRAGDLYASFLSRIECPLVMVNNKQKVGSHGYSVCTDTAQGAKVATDHLLTLGHRRITFIGGPPGHSSSERRRGYLAALQEAGVEIDHRFLLPGIGAAADGQRALPWLLDLGVTGVVCYNDLTALGILAAAAETGLQIPETLSVVGIDNLPYGALSTPRLTTVDQGMTELGHRAAQVAMAAIAGIAVEDVVLESRLIVRESTAAPGMG